MDSLIEKIKSLFNTEKYKDIKLEDGVTIIRVDGEDISEGAIVNIVTEDGVKPVEKAGDLVLEDGRIVSVDETGKVLAISKPGTDEAETEMAEAPATENTPEAESPEGQTKEDDRIGALEAEVAQLKEAVQMIVAHLQESMNKTKTVETENAVLKAENQEVKEKNEKLAKQNSAPAAFFKKFEKQEVVDKTSTSSLRQKIEALQESKNK